jgi:hypothetical protein
MDMKIRKERKKIGRYLERLEIKANRSIRGYCNVFKSRYCRKSFSALRRMAIKGEESRSVKMGLI